MIYVKKKENIVISDYDYVFDEDVVWRNMSCILKNNFENRQRSNLIDHDRFLHEVSIKLGILMNNNARSFTQSMDQKNFNAIRENLKKHV